MLPRLIQMGLLVPLGLCGLLFLQILIEEFYRFVKVLQLVDLTLQHFVEKLLVIL
jgi:hypothetical protein